MSEQQKKHDTMLEQGRKLYKLSYIDEDNDIQERVDTIIDNWYELREKCKSWYEDLEEELDNINEQEKMRDKFIHTLSNAVSDNPFKLHYKLKPESVNSEVVEELQVSV